VSCNPQACNVDCALSEWSKWSPCSRKCDGGSKKRIKEVAEGAIGTGKCWGPEHKKRRQFRDCGVTPCASLLRSKRKKLFQCRSAVDVQILVDGSGSLGWGGWEVAKDIAKILIENLDNGEHRAEVALELFSGPSTWGDYEKCVDSAGSVDMERTCRVSQVSHFTSDTRRVAAMATAMRFPARSTLTSVALGIAETEIKYGRQGAESVVVVITDGKPISNDLTREAAEALQKKARVVWIPLGLNAPLELIYQLASEPQAEHVIPAMDFLTMGKGAKKFNDLVNNITTIVCPDVV